ncbi:MAG: ABC transporter ATP-binding protein [Synergistetes bacterium]|nr:ABC transporter ATP-binding protein [Synergistota bacterium]
MNYILEVKDLRVSYGAIRALLGINLEVKRGEIVCVVGANGAGKSTLLKAIMGEVKKESGAILFEGKPLPQKTYEVVERGLTLVPEGRRVFANLTVYENLLMGAFPRKDREGIERDLNWVYSLFPRLKERESQLAGTLSGGEQQMLAIGRGLMRRPKILLLDEPSLGLAPVLVKEIFKELKRINEEGVTILLVEQNAKQALNISHRGYVLQTGRVVLEGTSKELLQKEELLKSYLGEIKREKA